MCSFVRVARGACAYSEARSRCFVLLFWIILVEVFVVRRKKIFWDKSTKKRERVLKICNNARIYNRYFSSSIISIVVIVSC